MKLHTYGLLRNSFRPAQEIRVMRPTAAAQRSRESAGRHILRMQKALTQMNCSWPLLTDISEQPDRPSSRPFWPANAIPHKLADFGIFASGE